MNLFFHRHPWWMVVLLEISQFTTKCAAIPILEILKTYPDLSVLTTLISASPAATTLLSKADNFTFLAPSNDAIASFNKKQAANFSTPGVLEAIVQYSLLQGVYATVELTREKSFARSALVNETWANVTGGQVVELVKDGRGVLNVGSGLMEVASSKETDIISVGGLVHIIDQVLTIPAYAVMELTSAKLEYLISILNVGEFLSADHVNLTVGVMVVPDVTFFVPNSALALSKFRAIADNSTHLEVQSIWEYHYVPDYLGYSSELKNGTVLTTAEGSEIFIMRQDGEVYVNAAKVIETDILCANGVIHVIDDLLDRTNISPHHHLNPPNPQSHPPSQKHPRHQTLQRPTPTLLPSANPSTATNTNLKIGIGVGSAMAGFLAIAAVFFFIRYRRAKDGGVGAWDGRPVGLSGTDKFYVARGKVRKHEEDLGLGLGLGSTGMEKD